MFYSFGLTFFGSRVTKNVTCAWAFAGPALPGSGGVALSP
jgi:hypothetical protein